MGKMILDESVGTQISRKKKELNARVPWYFAGGYLLFWVLLFFAVVIPLFYRLPTALTTEDANKNLFIAERAYNNLYTLSNIGLKLTGTHQNEVESVDFLLAELEKIKEDTLDDMFDIEIEVSHVSGMFLRTFQRVYDGLQNIVVKLSPKNSTSQTYLLLNSHFDSADGAPGAGDSGSMIVVMLEVLRVMATTKQYFEHPIVFLFNGAEENGLMASHGFITQHKWAPNCKALINLDAAGSGSREVLFQTGPNHPWLVKHYKKGAKHYFATSFAEEMFQAGVIPSDTDFRQFKIFGQIPGLDLAQCVNGFVYHTKYDQIDVISRESLQNTGDNILGLVRSLSNATELSDTEAYKEGHAVFFDFLGLYFIHYSEATGRLLNFGIAVAALILIFLSVWRMASLSKVSVCSVVPWFVLVFIIQVISFVLGLALPIAVSYVFDSMGLSMTHFSTPLLIIGLYVCPSLIGLSLPITIYYSLQGNRKISSAYHLQLGVHSQAIILGLMGSALTMLNYRSSYILVIPLLFYVLSLVLNLMTTLHDRGYAWTGLLKLSQIIPFLYSAYLFYVLIVVLTPMGGRSGSSSSWDLYIAVLAAAGTVLSFGFLIPLINTFRRPSFVILSLIAVSALSMYLASSTQLGFPYRPKTNAMRVQYLQVRRIFYEYDGTLSKDESGYLFQYLDRRMEKPLLNTRVNLTSLESIKSSCDKHMMCGMPLATTTCAVNPAACAWLPRAEPIVPPDLTTLQLLNKNIVNATTVRYEFRLTGPINTRLFIQPLDDVKIIDWSFLRSYLENPPAAPLPYYVQFKRGIENKPWEFYIDFMKPDGDFKVPVFQLGVAADFRESLGDATAQTFASHFPSFAILYQKPVIYQRYIY